MWIAHFASGLVSKPFAPLVPLWLLTFAGAANDALFFVLQFVGIESFNLDPSIAAHAGCFPYTNDYPYSHSLAGMVVTGVALAAWYKWYSTAPLTIKDLAVIVAATASHFLFEWPSHRQDTKITPNDNVAYGAGLFDYPVVTFVAEVTIFLAGLWVYTTFSPTATRTGYKTDSKRLPLVVAIMIAVQAQFCFMAAPTTETRWVHAPLFLGQILASCWMIGKLEA